MDLVNQVAQNTKENITNNNKIGSTIVRTCGEEHSAVSTTGEASIFLVADNDLEFISEYKFKIIFNNGEGYSWENNAPNPTEWVKGYMRWKSLQEFLDQYPLGSALDVDKMYGCQCVDYANAFWWGQCGRAIDCGGGNARGIWENAYSINMGTDFEPVIKWQDVKKGDWVVWKGSAYGHIALAMSSPDAEGKIKVWEQNGPNGTPWPSGGSTLAEGEMAGTYFLGAFRYSYW